MPSKNNTRPTVNYQKLNQELDNILSDLQSSDLPVDEAVELYERGLDIVKQLEDYLKNAELKVKRLKLEVSNAQSASED